MEHIDDTEIEVEEQVLETTEETTETETVENFSDKLEEAETEEEAIAAFNSTTEEEKPQDSVEEEGQAETVDTETESNSDRMFDLRDGDINISLNIDNEDERKQLLRLGQQGLNYAGKTTELAKHKSFVNYAEENGVSLEDIQMLAAAKKGDKAAIAQISKNGSVDVFDLDNDMAKEFAPEPIQLQQQVDPQIDSIANEILGNDEHKDAFQKWFPTMPQDVQNEVMSNSQVLHGVQEDITAGVFAPAMEQAYKYQRINGMDFGSAYTRAKQEYIAINQPEQVPPVTRGERQRASAPRSGGGTPSQSRGGYAAGAISDMNDDEFLRDYNKIIASVQSNR